MNKQELINRYTEKLLTQSNSLSQAVQESRNAIFRNVIADLELLDEPQKVKVPKCLAAYIDYSKSRGGDSVEEIFSPAWLSENDEVYNWLYDNSEDENDRRYLLAVRAYVEGDYEVEEEPKWVVKRKTFYFQKFTGFKFGVNCHEAKSEAALFTEKKKAEAVAVLIDGTVEKV